MATDKRILQRIDKTCAATATTRVDVLCVLLRALLVECAPTVEIRKVAPPNVKDNIMRAMRRSGGMTVRTLKQATNSRRVHANEWDESLQALCKAGELRVVDEQTDTGRIRRMVSLPDNGAAENGAL
jgi:hypothetical protein